MKRLICVLMACLLLLTCAQAAPRLPKSDGSAVDEAAVLSHHTLQEVAKLHELVIHDTGVGVYLATVDFFDGYAMNDYAQQLFDAWGLSDESILILLAVGEDKCTAVAGKDVKLYAGTLSKLVAASLEPAFLAQDYDGAVNAFMPVLVDELNKRYDADVDLGGLFGVPESRSAINWVERFAREAEDHAARAQSSVEKRMERSADDDDGFSLGKVILTFIFLSMIFGKRGRRGCGCAPFAGLFGLWKLWDRD